MQQRLINDGQLYPVFMKEWVVDANRSLLGGFFMSFEIATASHSSTNRQIGRIFLICLHVKPNYYIIII